MEPRCFPRLFDVQCHCSVMSKNWCPGNKSGDDDAPRDNEHSHPPGGDGDQRQGPVSQAVDRLKDIASGNEAVFMSVIGLIILVSYPWCLLICCVLTFHPLVVWQVLLIFVALIFERRRRAASRRRRRVPRHDAPPAEHDTHRHEPKRPDVQVSLSPHVLCACSAWIQFCDQMQQRTPAARADDDLIALAPVSASLEDLSRERLPLRPTRVRMPLSSPEFVTTSRILRENISRYLVLYAFDGQSSFPALLETPVIMLPWLNFRRTSRARRDIENLPGIHSPTRGPGSSTTSTPYKTASGNSSAMLSYPRLVCNISPSPFRVSTWRYG